IFLFWSVSLSLRVKGDTPMSNRIDRVVITGGSSGIGLDLARRFLAEGSSVVINRQDREKLERARRSLGEDRRVVAVAGHVGEPARCEPSPPPRASASVASTYWSTARGSS